MRRMYQEIRKKLKLSDRTAGLLLLLAYMIAGGLAGAALGYLAVELFPGGLASKTGLGIVVSAASAGVIAGGIRAAVKLLNL